MVLYEKQCSTAMACQVWWHVSKCELRRISRWSVFTLEVRIRSGFNKNSHRSGWVCFRVWVDWYKAFGTNTYHVHYNECIEFLYPDNSYGIIYTHKLHGQFYGGLSLEYPWGHIWPYHVFSTYIQPINFFAVCPIWLYGFLGVCESVCLMPVFLFPVLEQNSLQMVIE